jgi:hypothetical protein
VARSADAASDEYGRPPRVGELTGPEQAAAILTAPAAKAVAPVLPQHPRDGAPAAIPQR